MSESLQLTVLSRKDAMIGMFQDLTKHRYGDCESSGDRKTRLFCNWASDIIEGGDEDDFPLKFMTMRFGLRIYVRDDEDWGQISQEQFKRLKETVMVKYMNNEREYDPDHSRSHLVLRQYMVQWDDFQSWRTHL